MTWSQVFFICGFAAQTAGNLGTAWVLCAAAVASYAWERGLFG